MMDKIKEMLLEDDTMLLNVVRELNAYNNSFSELSYGTMGKWLYKLSVNGKVVTLDNIIELHKKKVDEIIIAMLKNYSYIDVCNGELEDYIEENNLI